MTRRTRYALIGTGDRARAYVRALLHEHREPAELIALLDAVPVHLDRFEDYIRGLAADGRSPVRYGAGGLERMIDEQKIDRVILTTPDATHADLTCRSLLAGADVIVEPPLTMDDAGARRIASAIEASGREVVVAFNQRHAPANTALRELLSAGGVGRITAVRAEWPSGRDPLLAQASHHFDLVNWWLDDVPARVSATAGDDLPLTVTVAYRGGATLHYTRRAEDEPRRVVIDGTEGTAELAAEERLTVRRHGAAEAREVPIAEPATDADARLFHALFRPWETEPPVPRVADVTAGLNAAAIGAAAVRSLEAGLPVDIAELDPAVP
ncbi:Gfo/Idh/MocA family protein [Streptomyces millisiae]|uniref:Gfo/Idh/MocA family oxidoreductase n=1 Tax=Streptomyces millisiae TaxID=3075542 RepID=A0ABU2LIZ8_9ACTN|nr:Gfo/Idh/MocA family oxidoreductase [Streptomyces sp. DSM 44918]MDT0317556.1 Gfo/Idh/MocA family oxidoreductase [Streptomyces sp. DSM 44918]